MSVSRVARVIVALRPTARVPSRVTAARRRRALNSPCGAPRQSAIASRNARFSSSVPTVTRRQSSSPASREVAHEHRVVVQQVAPERRGVLDAEQHEVRLARKDLDAFEHREPVDELVAATDDVADALLEDHALAEDRARDPLRERVHRVGLAHLHELADDVGVREQVAHAQPRERERLGERPQDDAGSGSASCAAASCGG